jgi:hypothetical protein
MISVNTLWKVQYLVRESEFQSWAMADTFSSKERAIDQMTIWRERHGHRNDYRLLCVKEYIEVTDD